MKLWPFFEKRYKEKIIIFEGDKGKRLMRIIG